MRDEMSPHLQQLLTEEQVAVMALLPMNKSGFPVFLTGRWPAYRGLFDGVYIAVEGDSIEEAVESFRRQLWRGL